jgi:threonine 3-dehydrogenase
MNMNMNMNIKMNALVKTERAPGLTFMQVDKPTPGPTEVLIKIIKTAICGTDLHIYNWDEWAQKTIPVPMHVGHEYVGMIVEMGSMVPELASHLKVGDRVSGEGHIVCGTCRSCRGGREHLCPNTIGTGVNRPGAFAEYLCIPARNVFKVPDFIPDDVVSIFDPFGNAVHTALSFNLIGEDVLITGAGAIGLMCVAICRFVGARHIVITDINPARLEMAKKMGATEGVNVSGLSPSDATLALKATMKNLGMTEGFDVGLEVSGQGSAISSMIDTLIAGGKIAALGVSSKTELSLPWNALVWKGITVKGIYGREMFETWYKMVALLQSGLDISQIITHRFPVKDYQQGFELMRKGECGKVILEW